MKLMIDISKDRYDEIMSMDWKNCRLIFGEELRAIHDGKVLAQEPCEDEYIKVPKKALKYRTTEMVAYNAEWLKNHFDIERDVICGAQEPCGDCVRREAVMHILDEVGGDFDSPREAVVPIDYIADMVSELPPVTPQPNKWIPVNQPPKASGRYIVTTRFLKHSQIEIADYATDLHKVDEYDFPKHEAGWYNYDSEYGHYAIDNVIAWMPLPKPMKEVIQIRADV